jgi:hypothetical protein
MKDRRVGAKPGACRKNPKSSHWSGKKGSSTGRKRCRNGYMRDRRVGAKPGACRKNHKSAHWSQKKRSSTGAKKKKKRSSTGVKKKRCGPGYMRDRRAGAKPGACRKNPRSTHWATEVPVVRAAPVVPVVRAAPVVVRPDPPAIGTPPAADAKVADMTSGEKVAALAAVEDDPAGGDDATIVARVDELLPAVVEDASKDDAGYEAQYAALAAIVTAHKAHKARRTYAPQRAAFITTMGSYATIDASGPVGGDEAAAKHAETLETLLKAANEINSRMNAMNAPMPRGMNYAAPEIKYSPENWIADRPARDDPPAHWAMPDPRLMWTIYDDMGEAGQAPSQAMRDVGFNPYGYLRQRQLKHIDDTLAIDGRPTTGVEPDEGSTADVARQYAVFAEHIKGRAMIPIADMFALIQSMTHAAVGNRTEEYQSVISSRVRHTIALLEKANVVDALDETHDVSSTGAAFILHSLLSWMGHEDLGQSDIYAQPGDDPYADHGTSDEWMGDFIGRVGSLDRALSGMEPQNLVFVANLMLPVDRDVRVPLDAYATLMEFYLQLGTVITTTHTDGPVTNQPSWAPLM